MLPVFERKRSLAPLNKCICLLLCLLLLPLSACKSKSDSIEEKYSNETKTLLSADFASETYPVEKSYLAATELSYSSFRDDQTVNALAMTVCGDKLAVLARSMAEDGIHFQTQICFFDQAGAETGSFSLEENLSTDDVIVSYIAGTKDGLTAFVTTFDTALQKVTKEFCFFDMTGNILRDAFPLTFTDTSFSPTGLTVLQSGETVLGGVNSEGNVFYVYGTDMCLLFTISGDQLTGKILESGGSVYVEGQGNLNGIQTILFHLVNMGTGTLSDVIDVSQITGACVTISNSGKLYAEDTTNLYSIDLDGKKNKTLVNWANLDIDRSVYSFISPICIFSDDVVCILGTSRDLGYDVGQIVMLTRQVSNPNTGKQTLILGGFGIASDDRLLSTIDTFNQSNDQYRIEIQDYLVNVDYSQSVEKSIEDFEQCRQQFYLAVYSGKGPDIFYSDAEWYTAMNSFAVYEANNLLMDLYPLMESDPEFHIDDFLPNVIDACTVDGKLCKIPVHFSVYGITGKPSVTKGISSWTTDEFDQIASTLPSGMQMIVNMTKVELLTESLAGSMNYFIDKNTKKTSFNSDAFIKILKWANRYGEVEPVSAEERIYVDVQQQIENGQLACISNDHINNTTYFSANFPMTYGTTPDIIGYPSPAKNGTYIYPVEQVAISSWCECPEGAWSFVKYLLSEDYQTKNSSDYEFANDIGMGFGFPVRTESLQAVVNLAMNPPDIEKVGEDPDAKPLILTQEQADACLAAINNANALYYPDFEIYAIIEEEVQAYFQGQKSVEEVSALIQNRVQTLVYERG